MLKREFLFLVGRLSQRLFKRRRMHFHEDDSADISWFGTRASGRHGLGGYQGVQVC